MSTLERSFYVFFLCLFLPVNVCAAASNLYVLEKISYKEDAESLENIFKEHWKLLASDHESRPYQKGKGALMFKNCSNIPGTKGKSLGIKFNGAFAGFITFFVAQQDIKLYGKIVVAKNEGCIPLMAIASEFHKKGLASHALYSVLNELKKCNCKTIRLSVNEENFAAQKLYKKFGFENTGISAVPENQKNKSFWWKFVNVENLKDLSDNKY